MIRAKGNGNIQSLRPSEFALVFGRVVAAPRLFLYGTALQRSHLGMGPNFIPNEVYLGKPEVKTQERLRMVGHAYSFC